MVFLLHEASNVGCHNALVQVYLASPRGKFQTHLGAVRPVPVASSLKLRRSSSLAVSVYFFHRAIQCAVQVQLAPQAPLLRFPFPVTCGRDSSSVYLSSLVCLVQFNFVRDPTALSPPSRIKNKTSQNCVIPFPPMSSLRFSGE